MKTLIITLLFASPALYVGVRSICGPCGAGDETARADVVRGRYLEARDASVFAGACHINGEALDQGRSALVAWSIEGGEFQGVALDGVQVVCAVSSTANLADDGVRSTIVYLDESLEPERRAAAVAWLGARHAATIGEVSAVKSVSLSLVFEGDAYELDIPGVLSLRGLALADRSCCTMKSEVWYEPLAEVDGAVVGNSEVCRFDGDAGIEGWAYQHENNSFVAYFRDEPASCCSSAPQVLCCEASIASEPVVSE